MINVLFIFGTRPEAIKVFPVIDRLKGNKLFKVKICVTAQHREMLDQVLNLFGIIPDYDLKIMSPSQSLFDITAKTLDGLRGVIDEWRKEISGSYVMIVQGDTTTTFSAALSSFYNKIPVAHIEAGLRSFDKFRPFPEELNRRMTSVIADVHFAPTERARNNLIREGIPESIIFVTGNTVIDSLLNIVESLEGYTHESLGFRDIDFSKKIILVTAHRRENFGVPLEDICNALFELAYSYKDSVEIVYPVHLNPEVKKSVLKILGTVKNIHLIDPLPYNLLVWLMNKSYFVMTDSGGLQEEAPSLGKPVLVMRDKTERPEGIEAGVSKLIGTTKKSIVESATTLLHIHEEYRKMTSAVNPYGDGKSSERIESILMKLFSKT